MKNLQIRALKERITFNKTTILIVINIPNDY